MVRGKNITVAPKKRPNERLHLLAAVSAEKGIEAIIIRKTTLNSVLFCQLLKILKNARWSAVVFAENAPYNTSSYTKSKADKFELDIVFNFPYKPDLNAIEKVFFIIKKEFKKEKAQANTSRRAIQYWEACIVILQQGVNSQHNELLQPSFIIMAAS